MAFFDQISEYAARRARQRSIYKELSTLSDRELVDLNLSRARLYELSYEFARQA
ncbi:MAG: DUF1127 domain-containing protein [Pseudomonadota bacterium]